MFLILDIETFADEESLHYREFRYLRDRGKGSEEEKVIEQLSLNPFIASIISISCAIFYPEEEGLSLEDFRVFYLREKGFSQPPRSIGISYMGNHFTLQAVPFEFREPDVKDIEDTESRLLEGFFNYVEDKMNAIKGVVTYNGKSFDMSFLFIRSIIHELRNPFIHNSHSLRMVDLLEEISQPKRLGIKLGRYSLDFVAGRLGFKAKFKISGKQVKDLFKRGEYEEIARYNAYDVIATAFLFKKLMPYIIEHPHEKVTINKRKFGENLLHNLEEVVTLLNRARTTISDHEEIIKRIELNSREQDLTDAVNGLIKVKRILNSILEL